MPNLAKLLAESRSGTYDLEGQPVTQGTSVAWREYTSLLVPTVVYLQLQARTGDRSLLEILIDEWLCNLGQGVWKSITSRPDAQFGIGVWLDEAHDRWVYSVTVVYKDIEAARSHARAENQRFAYDLGNQKLVTAY